MILWPYNGFHLHILRLQLISKDLVGKLRKKYYILISTFLVKLYIDVVLEVFLVVEFKFFLTKFVDQYYIRIHQKKIGWMIWKWLWLFDLWKKEKIFSPPPTSSLTLLLFLPRTLATPCDSMDFAQGVAISKFNASL